MLRPLVIPLRALFFVITTGQGGYAMSKSGSKPLLVSCAATSPKAALPDWLCPLFIERLANAHPTRTFAPAGGKAADVELLVGAMAGRRFEGQIRWKQKTGEPMGSMLSGGQLGPEILSRTLDQLIMITPTD